MTPPRDTDPRASGRGAIERLWHLGQRLAVARRDLRDTLPIYLPVAPEDPAALETARAELPSLSLSDLDQILIDGLLYRLSAVLSALTQEVMDEVLLAEDDLFLLYDTTDNLRDLERCGAIPSADEVLAVRERSWRHYRIATLRGVDQASALNRAWADGRVMLDMLVWLSGHLQGRNLFPGLSAFEEEPA